MNYLLNEHKPRYDTWFKAVMAIPVCLPLIAAIALYVSGSNEILETFIVFVFILAVIWLIMPRKFLVMEDRLRIVIGASISFSICYSNIREIGKPSTLALGVNYITSLKTPVEIVTRKGMNISIAPENRQAFLDDINRAIQEWRRLNNIND